MKRKSNTKARPNELQLFHLYPNGFVSFGKWLNYHRRMHGRHPLGCLHFGEKWLQRWEAAGRLLEAPAVRECQFVASRAWYAADHGSVRQLIRQCTMYDLGSARRVVLLDGTIIKEWGGK